MHTHAQKHQRSPWEKSGDLARPSAITARSHEVHSIPRLQQTSGNAQDAAETTAPPIVQEIVSSPGQPLDAGIRAFMEPRFGHDFGEMRVHAGPRAAHAAKSVSAVAYTAGRDIVVGRENVAPDTRQGRELIAHELAHVVQQSGRTPSEPSNLRSTCPDDAAERAAHSAAAAVAGPSGRKPAPEWRWLARWMEARPLPRRCWHLGMPAPLWSTWKDRAARTLVGPQVSRSLLFPSTGPTRLRRTSTSRTCWA
jgi:hypothetical protein